MITKKALPTKLISFFFSFIFFATPLIFLPYTSEIFEFNKMVLIYFITTIIISLWILRMIQEGKIIFRRTMLDIPLLLFLFSQILSTIFSMDTRTSIFGYYGRFNGGLLSTISYLLLYWAFVANMDAKETKKVLYSLLASGFIASLWGILEHFGKSPSCLLIRGNFNTDCWVQKVQERVFATFGQPNWLAAFIVALTPLAWTQLVSKFQIFKVSKKNTIFWFFASAIMFLALLYTKSRSGLLGFAGAYLIFWLPALFFYKKKVLKIFSLITVSFLLTTLIIGTPWTPNLNQIISKKVPNTISNIQNTTFEGGTESGEIRKIVWKGAIDIWKHYPFWGTGVETFAFSYYQFRPVEHNLTSEWDFIYNKAHNEYLNYLANTGILGLGSYLTVILFSAAQFSKFKIQNSKLDSYKPYTMNCALIAGYASLLITNFFGFSVVTTSILFFLLPAFSVSSSFLVKAPKYKKFLFGRVLVIPLLLTTFYILLIICKYWLADIYYAKAKSEIDEGNTAQAFSNIKKAIFLMPNEPVYHDELANVYAQAEAGDLSFNELEKVRLLSPKNLNLMRSRANILVDLANVDEKYSEMSIATLEEITLLAPTDPKTFYFLGISLIRANKKEKALQAFEKAISLKPDYEKAIKARMLLIDQTTFPD